MNRLVIISFAVSFVGLGMLSACSGKAEVNLEEPFKTACQGYFLEGLEEGEFLNEYKPKIVTRCGCLYTSFDAKLENEDVMFFTDSFKLKDPDKMQSLLTDRFGEEKTEAIGEMLMVCKNP